MISPLSSSTALVASLWIPSSVTAFVTRPAPLLTPATTTTTTTPPAIATTRLFGYLDDLSKELYAPDGSSSREEVDTDKMRMDKEQIDRYGVGSWEGFVDFDEFDGGDGQMGVAGDGNKGLEKEWQGAAEMGKSKAMSAKNAWGKSTGYADELIKQGVDTARAQQMENWKNQQEVLAARKQQRFMTEDFDKATTTGEEDWRNLSKYSGERLADTDLDAQLGEVKPGDKIYHHIQLSSRVGRPDIMEFDITNSFMGYSDFRARFTPETGADWSVEPTEGSLNGRSATAFTVRYRPQNPGTSSGYLVIETEDDKWTFQVTGQASM